MQKSMNNSVSKIYMHTHRSLIKHFKNTLPSFQPSLKGQSHETDFAFDDMYD